MAVRFCEIRGLMERKSLPVNRIDSHEGVARHDHVGWEVDSVLISVVDGWCYMGGQSQLEERL